MIDITFDFACRDDCLERMVPSDLRKLVAERDNLRQKQFLEESYRRKLFECQDDSDNLRSEYHNKMAEQESEIEELQDASLAKAQEVLSKFSDSLRGWARARWSSDISAQFLEGVEAACDQAENCAEQLTGLPMPSKQQSGEAVVAKDAYDGAREDLQIWKKRALEAEKLLQEEIESNARLVEVCNDLTGPTHMGEPVLPPRQGAQEAKPIAYTNGSQLFYLWDEEGEGKMFAEREGDYDIALYTRPPQSRGVPEGWRSVIQDAIDELSIMDESEGIAGWHLNGNVATWNESGLPAIQNALIELLVATPQPQGVPESLIEACEALKKDLLLRGEQMHDGIVTVDVSDGIWSWFKSALEAAKAPHPAWQESVPEGWKLVPIASTSEMDIAAHDRGIIGVSRDEAEIIWNVMLAAAPQPPQEGEGDA